MSFVPIFLFSAPLIAIMMLLTKYMHAAGALWNVLSGLVLLTVSVVWALGALALAAFPFWGFKGDVIFIEGDGLCTEILIPRGFREMRDYDFCNDGTLLVTRKVDWLTFCRTIRVTGNSVETSETIVSKNMHKVR